MATDGSSNHSCFAWKIDAALARLDALPHRHLLKRWLAKRDTGQPCPLDREMSPSSLEHCHKDLPIIERTGVNAYRYRQVGARFVAWMGRDATGLYLSDMLENQVYLDYLYDLFGELSEARSPVYTEGRFIMQTGVERDFKRLACPVSNTGEAIDHVYMVLTVGPHPDDGPSSSQWPPLTARENLRSVIDV